jgi:hypothetical protein
LPLEGICVINTLKKRLYRIIGKLVNKPEQPKLLESNQDIYNYFFPECNELPITDLFHYTDFNGLSGIITSKQLWMMHYKYLNDPSEVRFALNVITDLIRKNLEASKSTQFWQRFWALFTNGIEDTDVFVLSFCQDGNYLPAWRWYADDGAGFSIGFKKDYHYFKSYSERPKESTEPLCKFEIKSFPVRPLFVQKD